MSTPNLTVTAPRASTTEGLARLAATRARPSFCWSDIWKAPLHDFPIRDEILYQFLPLSREMDVLEIGPGSGFTAFRLARQVRHLTLLDVAPETIERLRESLAGLQNLNLLCADVCARRLAELVEGQFDAAFGLEVFEYVADPLACLTNLAKVLGRGGSLVLNWPNYPPARTRARTYIRTRSELDRLLDSAGFESWEVYALRLRPYAGLLFREFHEKPLHLYRRVRAGSVDDCPQNFDQTWAHRMRVRLEPYKCFLHLFWAALSAALRLGGDCFERSLLGGDNLDGNLLLVARR